MRRRRSRLGATLALGYAGLMLVAVLYVGYEMRYAPASSALTGVYLIVLTLPWSLLLGQLVGANGGWLAWACLGIGFLINSAVVYWVGGGIERLIGRFARRGATAGAAASGGPNDPGEEAR
jgi:hypothetical protein